MKPTIIRAAHLLGFRRLQVEPDTFESDLFPYLNIDVDLPDDELFEQCLHAMAVRWSSTGGAPCFKASMAVNGMVRRCDVGFVFVSGAGWYCQFATEEAIELERALLKNGEWEAAAKLREHNTVSYFNEAG